MCQFLTSSATFNYLQFSVQDNLGREVSTRFQLLCYSNEQYKHAALKACMDSAIILWL